MRRRGCPVAFFACVSAKSMDEILLARQYLIDLIEMLRPKKVVVNYGNHDIRFQNYLAKNIDEDLLALMPKTALELILIDGFNHYNKELHTRFITTLWLKCLVQKVLKSFTTTVGTAR